MKKLKKFEEHNNPYLHQPNVDNTTFPPPSSGSFGSAENIEDEEDRKLLGGFEDALYDKFHVLADELREEFPFCRDWTLAQFAHYIR